MNKNRYQELSFKNDIFQNFNKSFMIYYKHFKGQSDRRNGIVLDDYIEILRYLEIQVNCRGELSTIALIKHLRLIVFKSVASEELPKYPYLKTDKDGYPKIFGYKIIHSLKMRDKPCIRNLLTILQVSYLMKTSKTPSLDSIISPSTLCEDERNRFNTWAAANHKKILTLKSDTYWKAPHVSTKAGPLGPATWSSVNELALLKPDLIKDLAILGGPRFGMWLDNCYDCRDYLVKTQDHVNLGNKLPKINKSRTSLRRLTFVKSPEGKARVIAIFDYWSQTVLKEIHNWSFDQLRILRNDLTFNQGRFKEVLPKVGPYYSFDLKSATDRFPALLQRDVLSLLIGPKRAESWFSILCKHPFHCDWTDSEVYYAAGQPMGAYSSWSTFTICHHLVLLYSASLVNYANFGDYCILGDDIVIANKDVAMSYKSVMSKLGVEIDPAKTLVSNDTYEFAKRLIHQNEEITAFPLAAIVDNSKSLAAIWSVFTVVRERGFDVSSPSIPGIVAEFQVACGTPYRRSRELASKFEALSVLQRGPGDEYEEWAINTVHSLMNRSNSCTKRTDFKRALLLYDLGYFLMKYKALLLETAYQKYHAATFKLTGDDFGKGGIESMGSQAHAPIDIMRIPLVWIARVAVETQQRDIQILKSLNDQGAWEDIIRLRVTPIGDLNTVISRKVNMKQVAQSGALFKFLRKEQEILNALIQKELSN